jgi:hypothetical protein
MFARELIASRELIFASRDLEPADRRSLVSSGEAIRADHSIGFLGFGAFGQSCRESRYMRAGANDGGKRAVPAPRWNWSGVQAIDFRGRSQEDLRRIAKQVPHRRSSIDKIVARLRELRGRHHRHLLQDELGPTRAERAQALKALIEQVDALRAELESLAPELRALLAEELLADWSPAPPFEVDPFDSYAADKDAVEAVATATASLRQDLSRAGTADGGDTLHKVCSTAGRAAMYLSSLDSTTDADVAFGALSTDVTPAAGPANAIAVLAERLRRLRLRFERELVRLNAIKGPESSLSLELLVAQICDMWRQETGGRVTANPYRRYDYTGRPQTEVGRFVLQVVEALQPSKAWIGRHRAAASQKRAMIVMGARGFRAQAVHTAMRKYVAAGKPAVGPVFRPKHTL